MTIFLTILALISVALSLSLSFKIANCQLGSMSRSTQQLDVEGANRTIYHLDRYVQHQKFLNGTWVLHNLNGPAVIDKLEDKEQFFIDGVEYQDELQYLVAKEAYIQ